MVSVQISWLHCGKTERLGGRSWSRGEGASGQPGNRETEREREREREKQRDRERGDRKRKVLRAV
jgi:hypothetical protein